MLTCPSRSNTCPGLFTPLSLSPRIAYELGSRISPGAGEAAGDADGDGRIGPAVASAAGSGLLEGGADCGVMITGPGEVSGLGLAVGSGGGVIVPGEGEGGRGTRVCRRGGT